MAVDFSGIFTQAALRDAVDLLVPPSVIPRSTGRPRQNFTFTRDRHEQGRAQDISVPRSTREFVRSSYTAAEIAEGPISAEAMRTVREMAGSIDRIAFWSQAFRMSERDRSLAAADRPPPLAAPSSRLPSYRPRG
jgi:hypothetical protein